MNPKDIISRIEEKNNQHYFKDVRDLLYLLYNETLFDSIPLTPKQQLVLEKHWVEEKSFEKIASEMQVTMSRIRQCYADALYKVRDGLRVALENYAKFGDLRRENEDLKKTNQVLTARLSHYIGNWAANANMSSEAAGTVPVEVMEINLHKQNLSVRLDNVLASANIRTVGDVLQWNKNRLLDIDGFGVASLRELEMLLHSLKVEIKG